MSTKILTIDDSKTIRLIVAKAFKTYACTILEAANGVDGLACAGREKPDIILLDYTMPVMDGYEVLSKLRADPNLKSIPVIMLTAEAGRETVIRIAKLGVRDYLIKPFKEELLVERVGRVVTLQSKSVKPNGVRRFDDPISILVVDDKPAIGAQIKGGLADTNWKVNTVEDPELAVDRCREHGADIVLVSLTLAGEAAYSVFQNLRGQPNGASLPVFGLCVKALAAEQSRAQQSGFTGIITKPIDPEDLKNKVCRALKLETSYKYFQQRESALVLKLPKEFHPEVAQAVSGCLNEQLTATVDAGCDKLVVDLSDMEGASVPVIELVVNAAQACEQFSLRHAVVVTDLVKGAFRDYEDAQNWLFAKDFDEAVALMK
jgi:two-component system cell cycle response regulator